MTSGLLLLLSSISACSTRTDNAIESLEEQTYEESQNEESENTSNDALGEDATDEYGNPIEEDSTLDSEPETELVAETEREPSESLPDTAIYDNTVLDNYNLSIHSSERYTINYPNGYDVIPKDKYKTYLVKDNTQIFVYCINSFFENSDTVYYSTEIQDALYRMPYTIDGVSFTASVMDRKPVTKINIKGKDVAREEAYIEFASKDITKYVTPVCVSYFLPFDNRGFALIAYSTDQTAEELDTVLTDMVSTLGTYVPSKYEANFEIADTMYTPNDNTGIQIPYPDGWNIQIKNGLAIISAPENDELFSGAKIIYMTDTRRKYVDDYAQFAGVPDLIASLYMQPGYDPEKMSNDFTVLAMDDKITLDGLPCILFQIEDWLKPLNKTNELLLPSSGEKVYSYRYTFNNNGIPAMMSFQYTNHNKYQVRDMADVIMKQIIIK